MDKYKDNFLAKNINQYIKYLNQKDISYRKKEAKEALKRTGVITSKGTLKKKIIS